MHQSNPSSRASRSRRTQPAAALSMAGLLMLVLPVAVVAQEASAVPGDGATPFPTTLLGETLAPETFTGPEWLDQFRDGEASDITFIEGTEGLLSALDKDLGDLTVTTAMVESTPGNVGVVTALTVDGVESRTFARDAAQLMLGDLVSPELALDTLAGRWVLRVVDATMPGVYPRFIYLSDDTAWIIQADDDSVSEALEQLPAPSAVVSDEGDPVSGLVPVMLDDRRRQVLMEATEPISFLPTISERISPELEVWLLDVYLDAGISPTDMIGVLAFWGIEPTDSIEIEGYQLAGADDELVDRLRSEIMLAEGSELPEGISRVEGDVAGRAVTTLDFGVSKQHVFRSGDTVWIVTDHVGEPDMAEEAVAALP